MQLMGFEGALSALKDGARLRRTRWDHCDHNTWIFRQKGYPDGIGLNEQTAEAMHEEPGTEMVFRPYLMVRLGDQTVATWVPTTLDLFAEDWYVLEEPSGTPED